MLNEVRSDEFEKILKSALENIADRGTCVDTGGSVGEMYDGSRDYWVKYRGEEYFVTARKCKPKANTFTGQSVANPASEPVVKTKTVFDRDSAYEAIKACLKKSGQGDGFDNTSFNNGIVTALNIIHRIKNEDQNSKNALVGTVEMPNPPKQFTRFDGDTML